MSSTTKSGYFASYSPNFDEMALGIVHPYQAEHNVGDDYGCFEWFYDEDEGGKRIYLNTEIDDWKERAYEDVNQDALIRYICEKTGWDFSILRQLAKEVVEEDKDILPVWERPKGRHAA